jgi:ABC-type nitrate/sulfonate/bicarbonate transport system permease component
MSAATAPQVQSCTLSDRMQAHPVWARLGVIAFALCIWELAGHTILDPDFISPPSGIIAAMPSLLSDRAIRSALLISFVELVASFAIALVAGVLIGLPMGLHKFSLRTGLPLILLAYSIPQVTILPLFILYFGIGAAAKIAFGVTHGIFPIILNVIAGVQTVEEAHLRAARSMGASRWQMFRRVVLPHVTPSLFTGMRLGMSGCLLGVLLAELYVSSGGVGQYTKLFSETFNPSALLALVSLLAAMAIAMNEIVRGAERRASFWRSDRG